MRRISDGTTYRYCNGKVRYSFKWQNMAGAVAEAGAEIMDKGGAGAEDKLFLLNRNGSNTDLFPDPQRCRYRYTLWSSGLMDTESYRTQGSRLCWTGQ